MKDSLRQNLDTRQDIRLGIRISRQQVRFVKLLEMNSPELDEAVERELADNPALASSIPGEKEISTQTPDSEESLHATDFSLPTSDTPWYMLNLQKQNDDSSIPQFDNRDDSESIYDYLNAQLAERHLSTDVETMARYIIGSLDSNGYLTRNVSRLRDDLEFQQGIGITKEDSEKAFETVRSLEPPGIGAENLRDCLLLQLKRNKSTPATIATTILRDYFEEFSLKHFHRIMVSMKTERNSFDNALSLILSLNPKPGASIGNGVASEARQIIPDFVVEVDGDEITVGLNNRFPDLYIEESFANAVRRMEENARSRKEKGSEFILSRFNDARDFIRVLRQRQETLFAVITAIVKFQKEYFLTEDDHLLRPMGLKEISAITGYDISVVSRATNNKYVATPGGILPMRFFFSEAFGEEGSEVSGRGIEAAIRDCIASEDKRHPLSDDAICSTLRNQGYELSRRTVAKYRDRLGIPVARLRKDF